MAMTYGVHIGHMGGPLDEMRKLWKFADANGFDWFSVSDHFQESPPRGGDLDCYEAISTLTAADRKSTRLNSSHLVISYAVFCLKKKKKTNNILCPAPTVENTRSEINV